VFLLTRFDAPPDHVLARSAGAFGEPWTHSERDRRDRHETEQREYEQRHAPTLINTQQHAAQNRADDSADTEGKID